MLRGAHVCKERVAEVSRILGQLPEVNHAFAYGSGIFPQGSGLPTPSKDDMTDYIFAVECPRAWHTQNMELNRDHYTGLARLGGGVAAVIAERIGVGVHFNTLVPWEDKVIKYGVIGVGDLCRDLTLWETLYVGGRLHKPVLTLKEDERVSRANRTNVRAATATSLLLLPERFTTEDFFTKVCSISYTGDVRMHFAEDRGKVAKIVGGNPEGFWALYEDHLTRGGAVGSGAPVRGLSAVESAGGLGGVWIQDTGEGSRVELLASLPAGMLTRLARRCGGQASRVLDVADASQVRDLAAWVAGSGRHRELVSSAVGDIIRASSVRQAVAGLFAVGGRRSFEYVRRKVAKALRSRSGG